MTIKKDEIKRYLVHAICECGGELMITGLEHDSDMATKYEHICTLCQKAEWHRTKYPFWQWQAENGNPVYPS